MVGREASDDDHEGRLMAGRRFTIPAPSRAEPGPALAFRVQDRDHFVCVYCGAFGVTLEVDHVRARAHFPSTAPTSKVNSPRNLVAACTDCNLSKGPQDLEGFARMLRGRGVAAPVVAAMVRRVRASVRRRLPSAMNS